VFSIYIREKEVNFIGTKKMFKIYDDKTFIGKGFLLSDRKKEHLVDIFYEEQNRSGHMLGLGTTRVGKTRSIEATVHQDIMRGYSTTIIDPKGDWELWARIYDSAKRAGRLKDIFFVSPFYPHLSNKMNIMSSFSLDDELINHIVAGIPIGGDPFYYNVAYEVSSALVRAKLLLRNGVPTELRKPLTMREIAHSASYKGLEELALAVEAVGGIDDDIRKDVLISLNQILESPQDNYSKIAKSLKTTLSQLTQGNIGKIVGSEHNNAFIDRIERGGSAILYVQTGSLLTRQSSATLARVIVSSIQALAGRLYAQDKKLKTPLTLYIDEFSNVVYMGIEDLFNKAGGANIWVHAYTQNFADIIAEVGQDRAEKIGGNMNAKMCMRLAQTKSSFGVSEMGGTITDYSAVLGIGGMLNAREVDMEVIKPTDALNLGKREYFYFGFEGNYRGKTPPISPVNIRFKLPEIQAI